jgi:hypothetical protein
LTVEERNIVTQNRILIFVSLLIFFMGINLISRECKCTKKINWQGAKHVLPFTGMGWDGVGWGRVGDKDKKEARFLM